jgi:hypothetical protein
MENIVTADDHTPLIHLGTCDEFEKKGEMLMIDHQAQARHDLDLTQTN